MQPILPTPALAADDKRFLRVYHQSMPKTQFLQQPELSPGREVRISEEPLIARCLQRNVPLEGKRELSLGQFAGVRVYPVQDRRGKCFAAVVFDLSGVDDPAYFSGGRYYNANRPAYQQRTN